MVAFKQPTLYRDKLSTSRVGITRLANGFVSLTPIWSTKAQNTDLYEEGQKINAPNPD